MNVKLKILLPGFKRQGTQYERDCVIKAVEAGTLKLDLTTRWLDEAKEALQVAALATDAATVHANAMAKLLLCDDSDALPETLVFDKDRIEDMRAELRGIVF